MITMKIGGGTQESVEEKAEAKEKESKSNTRSKTSNSKTNTGKTSPKIKAPFDSIAWLVKSSSSRFKHLLPTCPNCGDTSKNYRVEKDKLFCLNCKKESKWEPPASWVLILETKEWLNKTR